MVSGAVSWLERYGSRDITAVAIAPDLGERYLQTVYDTDWVEENYGVDVLNGEGIPAYPPSMGRRPTQRQEAPVSMS
ncbi:hypothetical protein D3C83_140060 [compost metagenome]